MVLSNNAPLIYNLFPRVFENIDSWTSHLDTISKLSFNSIYVNPFHETGGSRSLYAVKDYFKISLEIIKSGSDGIRELRGFIDASHSRGLAVYMDLVINHTANESVLVSEYPQWFRRDGAGNLVHPYAIDPANPSVVTVWGDLAEINYDNNPDFNNLRAYWDKLIAYYQDIGFDGFRCDAAYKVPCGMWQPLISSAKKRDEKVQFFAETLGCTLGQMQALGSCGFDYFFNSSKWWNFESPWCTDQHASFKGIAPSISFPESHDTNRVASEQPGTLEWQKNRYVLATIFSKGLLMPVGYEYGATSKLDVVNSKPSDGFRGKWDLSQWISQINRFKTTSIDLNQEGCWEPVWGFDDHVLFLLRRSDDNSRTSGFLVNKDWYNGKVIYRDRFPWQFGRFRNIVKLFDNPLKLLPLEANVVLAPSEIILFSD